MLKCDVCGGRLSIDAGGKTATCEYCGAKHSMERMREKVQEIKGTVSIEGEVQTRQTGTSEDVKQWKKLLDKYMKAFDFKEALSIVNKILEANPADEEAGKIYDLLQEWKYFDIRNGVLEKYNGNSETIVVPEGVVKIKRGALSRWTDLTLILPDSLEECELFKGDILFTGIGANTIRFGRNIKHISGYVYCKKAILTGNCDLIMQQIGSRILCLPENYDGDPLLLHKNSCLEKIEGNDRFLQKVMQYDWLGWLEKQKSDDIDTIANRAVLSRKSVETILCDNYFEGITGSPLIKPIVIERINERALRYERRLKNVCQYCGGKFRGIIKQTCSNCNRERDY